MPGLTWPGKGPRESGRFRSPLPSQQFAQVLGNTLNPNQTPSPAPTGILPIRAIYLLSLPQIDSTILNFGFNTSTPDGAFSFVFKWIGGVWNNWVTLPDGSTRPAGCIPQVLNWLAYRDFSTVIVSSLPVLGAGDLVGKPLFLIKWKT